MNLFSHEGIVFGSTGLLGWSGSASDSLLLYYLALVPALGVTAQWIAWRTRLPSILLLLLFGILLGQYGSPEEILARVNGSDDVTAGTRILFPLVSLSVAIIMFEGGLSLRLGELRDAGTAVLRLVTIGALVTWGVSALAAYWLLDFGPRMALLLGAILVVTGPTVILPMLRQIRPSRRIESTLKWEGIVIDPIGALLAVLVFEELLIDSNRFSFASVAVILGRTVLVGVSLGYFGAWMIAGSFRRFWVPDYLQGILALAVALVLFSGSNYLADESGLVTVTVMGIALANQKKVSLLHVIELKEHLRTLLIGCLFILLGSRIKPAEIFSLGFGGVAFVVVLILVVRPLATWIALAGSQLDWREKVFVGSLAPRGIVAAAVSSVFALRLDRLEGGLWTSDQTTRLVSVVFMTIVGTVAFYGLIAGPLARRLGLSRPNPQGLLIAGADAWVRDMAKVLHENGVPLLLVDTNYNKISAARMAGLPAECLNILSDHAVAELNLSNLGRLLALTPNDEVNSLAVQEFRHLFSRAGVYQLGFKTAGSAQRRSLASHLQGRVLFGADWTFSKFREIVEAGAVFKATKLSDTFRYSDFQAKYGRDVLLMFVTDGSLVQINALDAKIVPKSGDTLISLVPSVPVPASHPASVNLVETPSDSSSGPTVEPIEVDSSHANEVGDGNGN